MDGQLRAAADAARLARYAGLAAFHEGEQWPARAVRGETRITLNYARALSRKVASYVFSGPVRFAVIAGPDAAEAATRAERELARLVRTLGLDALDSDLAVAASVLGDAAIKVTWDAAAGRPAVVAVDPAGLAVESPGDNPRAITRIHHTYRLTADQAADILAVRRPSRGDVTVTESWSDERWLIGIDGDVVRDEPNPYGWIPYVLAPNNPRADSVWGESDLTDLIAVCRELNSRMSVLARVLEVSGAPITVLENVDSAEGVRVGPGATWELPEGSRAYLLDLLQGGGVGLHIQYIDLLYRALHDLSETPRTAFGDSGRPLSGAALEVEIQPLVQKVRRKRLTWDGVHRARNSRLLDLLERFGGVDLGGLRETETIWPSVLPSDVGEAVRNAVALVGSGIQSRRTAWAALGGIDPEAELARVHEEAEVGA